MVQSDLLLLLLLLLRPSALEPRIGLFFFFLLFSSSSSPASIGKREGKRCRARKDQPRLCSPAGSTESRRERVWELQVLIVPLCGHVRLHQESRVEQRTRRRRGGGGSAQRKPGSALPRSAQLHRGTNTTTQPAARYYLTPKKPLSGASQDNLRSPVSKMENDDSCGPTEIKRDRDNVVLISLPTLQISFGFGMLIYSVNMRDRGVCHSLAAYPLAKTSVSKPCSRLPG